MAVAHDEKRPTASLMVETDQSRSTAIDTGQQIADIGTGQAAHLSCDAALALLSDAVLSIAHHEIHRIDEVGEGAPSEFVISTLKAFKLSVAVQAPSGNKSRDLDGCVLRARLTYEDGSLVEEVSATQEPPLLGGQAIVENTTASFRLRITVLSSLCHARKFRVHVHADGCPELAVMSSAVKTITKLRRGSRESREAAREARELQLQLQLQREHQGDTLTHAPRSPMRDAAALLDSPIASHWPSCGGKRSLGLIDGLEGWKDSACCDTATAHLGDPRRTLQEYAAVDACVQDDLSSHTLDQLWDEIHHNGSKLLELQQQQRQLFKQLRSMREACEQRQVCLEHAPMACVL